MAKAEVVYHHVPGFFAHDDDEADGVAIGALPPRFGLLDDTSECWTNFIKRMELLNASAPDGTCYKALFLGRHGEGYHNVAEAKYGTTAWDVHWSKLNGDGDITWGPDPLLTPLGINQAHDAQIAWRMEINRGMPRPQQSYTSPLKRAADTWALTFGGERTAHILAQDNVNVLENCREEYGVHTCDKRSPLSELRDWYEPHMLIFDDDFAEEDPLWRPDERETREHVALRARGVLDTVFEADNDTYISITAHSGFVNGLLAAIGRPRYALPTGGVLPVVVKRSESGGDT